MPQIQQETVNAVLTKETEKIPHSAWNLCIIKGFLYIHQEQSGTLDFKFIRFHVSIKVDLTEWEKLSFMKITNVFLNTASLLNTKYTLLKLLEKLFGTMI